MKLCFIGKLYAVFVLLQNVHTCLYGNQEPSVFGMEPISLQEYFHERFCNSCISSPFNWHVVKIVERIRCEVSWKTDVSTLLN